MTFPYPRLTTFAYPITAFAIRSPLFLACADGDEVQARQLLDTGADINEGGGSRDNSPLIAAARAGHVHIVASLLSKYARIDLGIDGGGSALLHACSAGHLEVVKMLLNAGADYRRSQERGTPLQCAARYGKTTIVELLLDLGEPLNPRPKNQVEKVKTPLFRAAEGGYEDTMRMLIRRGADVNLKSAFGNQWLTPLYAATIGPPHWIHWLGPAARKERERANIVRLLIDAGAALNDLPAFHNAAYRGQTEIVKMLINAGIDISNEGFHGTALQEASEQGHAEIVELLLAAGAGATINIPNDYAPALISAARGNHEKIVEMLLEAGADVDIRSNENSTGDYGTSRQVRDD